jgi:hypothetical protein
MARAPRSDAACGGQESRHSAYRWSSAGTARCLLLRHVLQLVPRSTFVYAGGDRQSRANATQSYGRLTRMPCEASERDSEERLRRSHARLHPGRAARRHGSHGDHVTGGWQGVDGIARARESNQVRLEQILRLETVIAQWEQDLAALQETTAVPTLSCDGQSVRLVRRTEHGLQVVAWSLRPDSPGSVWQRWAGPPSRRSRTSRRAGYGRSSSRQRDRPAACRHRPRGVARLLLPGQSRGRTASRRATSPSSPRFRAPPHVFVGCETNVGSCARLRAVVPIWTRLGAGGGNGRERCCRAASASSSPSLRAAA